ncbi:unnamed protein product [Caenorhabditis bovis]|uniref:Leucine-rich PPR motif-containing protein, mitochondrial n=1 Tax=Caenorhabditis bovis TaxID=2654633 RepID=A0A8S1E5Y0_9PELO|nr:unnamed protein product [Caenorhabditis bovis]
MLGIGRNGLKKIGSRRMFSTVVVKTVPHLFYFEASSPTAPVSAPPANESKKGISKNKSVQSTSIEQIRLQKKYEEDLQNNKTNTLHEVIETIEWRGAVYSQTLEKIVGLLENSNDLSDFSDRQLSVILSAFGSKCETVSKQIKLRYFEKAFESLQAKSPNMGLLSHNAILEVMLANNSQTNAIEELNKFEEIGLEPDSTSFALICEIYAKQGNSKAITDIIQHMKENGVAVEEDHIVQLVYSLAKGGNDGQAERVADSFASKMNIVRLRCAAAQAIIQREKYKPGHGGFEVSEILRGIPATAKLLKNENNVFVIDLLIELIEAGQLEAFKLLSPYLSLSEDGQHLGEHHKNSSVVARARCIMSEGKLNEAIALYSVANKAFANEYFCRELRQKMEENLKNVNNDNFDPYLKTLVLAENRGIIKCANQFLLTTISNIETPAFLKIFSYIKNSGQLREILTHNGHVKRPLARKLSHKMISSYSSLEQAEILGDIASVCFTSSNEETVQDIISYYPIIFKLCGKDVKLAINALKSISDYYVKREFATAIVHQILKTFNEDHVALDKISSFLESDNVENLNAIRLQPLLTKFLLKNENVDEKLRIQIVARILAYDFPKENIRVSKRFCGRNVARFLANEMISEERAYRIVAILENESRVSLTSEEIKEAKEILNANPKKAELIEKLKKSQTMTRWRASSVEELLKEIENFKQDTKLEVLNALRNVIVEKAMAERIDDCNFLVEILEKSKEWKEHGKMSSQLAFSLRKLENLTLLRALSSNNDVLADRIWVMRSGHLLADVTLAYASRLFLNGQIERADEVCEDLRLSSQPIRPNTLEKMGRRLKDVDSSKMGNLADYLKKQFNLSAKNSRRIVAQVKLEILNKMIQSGDLASALKMAVGETKESGRAFGQVPLMIAAIQQNDRKLLEDVHVMVRTAHNQEMANINLAYSLLVADHVEQAKQLVERQNLAAEDNVLQYFVTLSSAHHNANVLKNLFLVFNGRASTLQLNNLLEILTRMMWKNGDLDGLREIEAEIEQSSFPLQHKLRKFFEDLTTFSTLAKDEIREILRISNTDFMHGFTRYKQLREFNDTPDWGVVRMSSIAYSNGYRKTAEEILKQQFEEVGGAQIQVRHKNITEEQISSAIERVCRNSTISEAFNFFETLKKYKYCTNRDVYLNLLVKKSLESANSWNDTVKLLQSTIRDDKRGKNMKMCVLQLLKAAREREETVEGMYSS